MIRSHLKFSHVATAQQFACTKLGPDWIIQIQIREKKMLTRFQSWAYKGLVKWLPPRADSRFAPSQWQTALLCNDVSHWLGANLGSALSYHWCYANLMTEHKDDNQMQKFYYSYPSTSSTTVKKAKLSQMSWHFKVGRSAQKSYQITYQILTHWGRMTHIFISNLTIVGSDNGLVPTRYQAIIWTNAGILLIGPFGTNFSAILIESLAFSFKKMLLKVLSAKWWPFCLGLNVLIGQLCKKLWQISNRLVSRKKIIFMAQLVSVWCDRWFLSETHPMARCHQNLDWCHTLSNQSESK